MAVSALAGSIGLGDADELEATRTTTTLAFAGLASVDR